LTKRGFAKASLKNYKHNKDTDMNYENNARIWEEMITIPTYPSLPADPNPMFFEERGNQGASGRIYPNPITDRLSHEGKSDQEYQAVFLENEYIQLMVLPRFGGRIHAALDKSNQYDFIYRQHVIKPGLIGLFGSWISGGMEFNWPLHHRPSTFMPVEYKLEESADGSVTLWMSEHEPMNRMKGMLGVCVYPGKAFFEFKVQLYNRTALPQPFLWWVNTGVKFNDDFQLIFPPDVESVTFHSRAYMAEYPVAKQIYAGLDWTEGVDISWPKDVNEATSYFANPSKYEFFGGYDHGKKAGIIHVANRHISPGKKLFTWGTADFGTGWQSTLTDDDGPYLELMASAYSDNQPDFTWMQPYETKTFTQILYPIQEIGLVKNANQNIAVNLEPDFVGVYATQIFPAASVHVTVGTETVLKETVDLQPGKPFIRNLTTNSQNQSVGVYDSQGNELVSYSTHIPKNEALPETAKPPTLPHNIDSIEELYLTGLHVEQYLHSTLDPAIYWQRALELDSSDSRSNNALGRLRMRRGDFAGAEPLFRTAIKTLTRYNFNPLDGEPHYNLGLTLVYQGRFDEAYDHFYKATWSYAQRAPAYFSVAQIDVRRGDYAKAIAHLDRALVTNAHNNKARALKAAALRRSGKTSEALNVVQETLEYDPLDIWTHNELALLTGDFHELARILRGSVQNYLDLALEYAGAGLFDEASQVLNQGDFSYPIVYYALGYFAAQLGDVDAAQSWYQKGAAQPPDYCFPLRLEEQIILESVLQSNPTDGRAAYYLGNLYYDKRQYDNAIAVWQTATEQEPGFSIPWRNLGIALYNKRGNKQRAKECYDQALAANSGDPRLLMEMDQLLQRLGASQAERLASLENQAWLVGQRDDLAITFAELYSQTGQPDKALDILATHQFHAWEGGEGGAAGQYALAQVVAGLSAQDVGNLEQALTHFTAAQKPPDNLGVGRGMSMYDVLAWFNLAETLSALGNPDKAKDFYKKVIDAEKRFTRWGGASALTYYAALSLRALGQPSNADQKMSVLKEFAQQKLEAGSEANFFTSKPTMVVFDDDPQVANQIQGHYLMGLASLGLGKSQEAEASFKSVLALDPHHWWSQLQISKIRK
jgi:tetratricopeptide (TPR) repeat protein